MKSMVILDSLRRGAGSVKICIGERGKLILLERFCLCILLVNIFSYVVGGESARCW